MSINWAEFFQREASIRTLARRAGLAPDRADAVAERLASRPLDRSTSDRLVTHLRARISGVGRPGSDDPRIVAAHARLQQLEPDGCPALASIRVAAMSSRRHATCAHNGTILINTDSPWYQRAGDGDLLPFATLLFHEGCHQRHPTASEDEVIGAELRFAERHGGSAWVAEVRRELRS